MHLSFYSVRFMMWYPNLVLTGAEVCPFSSSKAAFSNSFTILPLVKVPKSPPFLLDGQRETCWATAPNFSPLSRRAFAAFASVSVLTSMWQQCTLSGITRLKGFQNITFAWLIKPFSDGKNWIVGFYLNLSRNYTVLMTLNLHENVKTLNCNFQLLRTSKYASEILL